MEIPNSLPTRLRWTREIAGLSMRSLSDLSDLDPSHIRLIELGDRPDPRVDTLGAIARVLGTTVDWLAFGHGTAPTAEEIAAAVDRARAAQATEALAPTGTG